MAAKATASSNAVRRLGRELQQLENSSNPQLVVRPTTDSLLVWHFVLHSLPEDTPFKDGCYQGKLVFPADYPHAAPSLLMLTPNGRLEVNRRLCLSMTDFHPESWNPAWSIESILVGLISFMIDEAEPHGIGVVKQSAEARQRLATSSWAYNATQPEFMELFPQWADPATAPLSHTQSQPECKISVDDAPEVAEDIADEGAHPVIPASLEEASGSSPAASAVETDVAASTDEMQPQADCPGSAGSADIPGAVSVSEPSASGPEEDDSETTPECWICREDGTQEPLIQPCACTGSMSGVHASCVEQWIRTHRENAQTDELPHCSVCGEPYAGNEKRPGPVGFARHLCSDFAQQAGRSTLLVGLLVAYWAAAQPDAVTSWQPGPLGLGIRILLLVVSGTFFCYQAVVLIVSLPRGRPQPENCFRVFHISDFRLLAVHIAEAIATVVIAGLWCAYGQLPYYYFLPLCLLVILPLINILLRHESTPCSTRSCMVVVFIIGSPIVVMIHLGKLVYQNPKRLVDPFDGVLHMLVPIIAIPLCWFCSSSVPVLILWGLHSLGLIASLVEKNVVKRMHWKEGRIWWIAMQLSVLAAYIGNLLHSSSEVQELGHQAQILILGVSLLWLFLVCNLAIQVNWGLCVEQYRAWQQRNGSFALTNAPRDPATDPVSPHAVGAQTIGPTTPPARQAATAAGSTGVVPNRHEEV